MKLQIVISIAFGLAIAVLCQELSASDKGMSKQRENSKKRFLSDNAQLASSNGGVDGKLVDWFRMFKRFDTGNSDQFGQNYNNFVKWNTAFDKRLHDNTESFPKIDGSMVDWSSMYKRFGTETVSPDLVDWSAMFQKNKRSKRSATGFKRFRTGDMSFMPESFRSDDFIDWSRVFSKRGFGGYNGAFGNPSKGYALQDWRNLMTKGLLDRKRRATSE